MQKRAVIIGYGGMGNWHRNAIQEVEGLKVHGVFDIRQEINQEAKSQHLTVYEKFEDILNDEKIDIVIIATPNDSHKNYIIKSLEAGKHVVCEKPVTLSVQDLEDIMEVEKNSDSFFTIHQNRRWDTDFRMVQQIFENNLIGTPYFVETRVNGSSVFLHGWRDFKINGGGMLYDWGVHLIDQLLQLNKTPVTSVTAHLKNVFSEEVDDNIKLLLEFEDGLSAVVEVATNCFIPFPRWHLSGNSGTAIIENWQCDGRIMQLIDGTEPTWNNEIVYTAAGPTRTMAPRPKTTLQELPLPEVTPDPAIKHYSATVFYNNFLNTIEGKEKLLVTSKEAIRVIKVIEAAFESNRLGHGISCHI